MREGVKRRHQDVAEYNYRHCSQRFEERYGRALSREDYVVLCGAAAVAQVVGGDQRESVREVEFAGNLVLAVRNEATGRVTTVLPRRDGRKGLKVAAGQPDAVPEE